MSFLSDEFTNNGGLSGAISEGRAYSFYFDQVVPAGEYISLNVTFASNIIAHHISVTDGLRVDIRNSASLGSSGEVVPAQNLNLCSVDVSPASAQVITGSTPQETILCFDTSSMKPLVESCFNMPFSVNAKNDSADEINFEMSVTFEETGTREASFGLTPSTFLLPPTEMSDFL